VALVENGTHVLFGARPGGFAMGETTLARQALAALRPGMPCLADRLSFLHAVRVVRRKLPLFAAPPRARRGLHEAVLDEILEERVTGTVKLAAGRLAGVGQGG
jgi:hypothetical protein